MFGNLSAKYGKHDFRSRNSIALHTNRGEYAAGETIYGTIFLQCAEQVPSKGLFVKIKGKEKASFEVTKYKNNEQGQQERYQKHCSTKRKLLDVKLPIAPGGSVPPGSWVYYFQWPIPQGLPGVFAIHEHNAKGEIKYTIGTELDIPNTGKDLEVKQLLYIRTPLPGPFRPVSYSKTHEVRTLCCIPRGPIHCTVTLDGSFYNSGSIVNCTAVIKNESAVEIDGFNIHLIRAVTLRADGEHFTDRQHMFSAKYPGCEPGGEKTTHMPLSLTGKNQQRMLPSTRGQLVTCEYHVLAEFSIPFAPDLEILHPVTIFILTNDMWMAWQPPMWGTQAQVAQTDPSCAINPSALTGMLGTNNYMHQPPQDDMSKAIAEDMQYSGGSAVTPLLAPQNF